MVQCLFEYKSDWIFILKADFSLLAVCILLVSKAFLIYIGLIPWEVLENTAVERKEKRKKNIDVDLFIIITNTEVNTSFFICRNFN